MNEHIFTYIYVCFFIIISGGRLVYEDFRELHSECKVTRACHGQRSQIIWISGSFHELDSVYSLLILVVMYCHILANGLCAICNKLPPPSNLVLGMIFHTVMCLKVVYIK